MPVGAHLVSAARAILEIDKGPFDEGLRQASGDLRSFARTGESSLRGLTDAQLRVKVAENELAGAIRRRGESSNSAIRATLRLRDAERALKTESLEAARAEAKQIYELRRMAEQSGLAGRGFLAFHRDVRRATGAVDEHGRAVQRTSLLSRATGRHRGEHAFGSARVREEGGRLRLRGAAGFAGSNLLGLGIGFGAAEGVRASVDAAVAEEQAVAALNRQLRVFGQNTAENRKQIDETLSAQSKMSGFIKDELIGSFTTLFRRTGDVSESLKLNAVAMDIARAKGKDLGTISMLLNRALAGNSRAATALGLPLVTVTTNMDKLRATTKHATSEQIANAKAADKAATGQAIIAEATKRYGGQAAAAAKTAAGAQRSFHRALHDTEVIVGTAVIPVISRLASRLANYLDRLNKTGRLQRDVNKVIHTTGTVFGVMKTLISPVITAFRNFSRNVGGTRHALELLVGAFAAFKIAGMLLKLAELVKGFQALKTAEVLAAEASVLPAAGAAGGVGAAVLRGGPAAAAAAAAARAGRFGLRGIGGKVLGSALGSVAFGVGFALAQRGESGSVEHLGGPLDITVSGIPGGDDAIILYTDPVTGDHHTLRVKKSTNIAAAIRADLLKRHPNLADTRPTGAQATSTAQSEHVAQQQAAARRRRRGGGGTRDRGPRPEKFTDIIPDRLGGAVLDAQLARGGRGDDAALRRAYEAEKVFLKHEQTLAKTEAQRNSIKQQLLGVEQDELALAKQKKGKTPPSSLLSLLGGGVLGAVENARGAQQEAKALHGELRAINRRLHQGHLTARQRLVLEHERRRVEKKLEPDGASGSLSSNKTWLRLENARYVAEQTKDTKDDIRALRSEDKFLRAFRQRHDISQKTRVQANKYLASVDKKLDKFNPKDAWQAMQREFLTELANIYGSYASNFGVNPVTAPGTTTIVNNHQHFPHPPTMPPFREAIYAKHAMQAAFD